MSSPKRVSSMTGKLACLAPQRPSVAGKTTTGGRAPLSSKSPYAGSSSESRTLHRSDNYWPAQNRLQQVALCGDSLGGAAAGGVSRGGDHQSFVRSQRRGLARESVAVALAVS